ncbi:MAG: sigma-70 family RNA polymerase sigma factor [Acidimicrobiia bacterium]|nr:sigma-70 family RNA polymerase sigma factor [Acidimicrobiia bacterium]
MTKGRPVDDTVDPRFHEYRQTRDPEIRAALVDEYWWIVSYVARRYQGRGEPLDDITQVAALGVVAAVGRFDPETGSSFPAFAIPTALGEVRRHFRDKTWRVRVPRRVKDLTVQVTSATEELMSDLGRAPTAEELGDRLNVSAAQIREAWSATAASRPISADTAGREGEDSPSVLDLRMTRSAVDPQGISDNRMLVSELLRSLPQRSQEVVVLRFFEGLSQAEVADRVGISQPHVSRILRTSLRELRERLNEPDGDRGRA